jgi:hypothetical protein
MTLTGFSPGSYTYTCNFASGGDASYTVGVSQDPQTWDNGATCYDLEPGDTVWVTIGSVSSNQVTVPGSQPTPPPPPSPSISIGWSSAHPGWIWMTLTGYSPGSYRYTCNFASGGDETYTVGVSQDPQTWDNAETCYDLDPGDTVWVTIGSASSNQIRVP